MSKGVKGESKLKRSSKKEKACDNDETRSLEKG